MIISSTKINQLVIISLFLPTLLHHFTSFPNLDPFTPRALIHSRTWIPFFTSSWSPPPDLSSLVSRLSQLCLISLLPAHMLGWGYLYLLFLAGTRTLVGYIFSRSVGWAYPPLFSHWALYESSSGVGPARLASLIMGGQENILERMPERAKELGSLMMVPCLTMAFCWLEGSPWTYGISTILILILVVAKTVYGYRRSRTGYTIAPDTPSSTISTNENEDEKSTYDFTTSTPFRTSLYSLGLALLTILIPYFIISIIIPPFRLPFPLSTSPDRPMLDMIILSYPRPVDILLGTRIINQTISSFLPFISPNQITLSIFTHSTSHPALHQAQLDFSHSDISFYRGTDSHPGYSDNHYLHLSEVFRWAYEKDNKAEWIMLIEDDFPVCNGNDGWVVISTVMAMLESRRLGGMDIGEIDIGSGMIGTGGRYVANLLELFQ